MDSVEIMILHYYCGYWDFPKMDDILTQIVDWKYVFMGHVRKGIIFKEDQKALDIYQIIKSMK